MSTSKIPYVMLFWLSSLAVTKPPQPIPPKEELVNTGNVADNNTASAIRVPLAMSLQTAFMLAEVAAILASQYPSQPLAVWISGSVTFKGGHPKDITLTSISAAGVLFMALAAIIRQWSFRTLGAFFRYEVSIQKDHQLITNGPYAIVRHPAYTGLLLAVIGWFLYFLANGSYLRESGFLNSFGGKAFTICYAVFGLFGALLQTLGRMSHEDSILRVQFGRKWDQWAKQVPYMIIPGIW